MKGIWFNIKIVICIPTRIKLGVLEITVFIIDFFGDLFLSYIDQYLQLKNYSFGLIFGL